MEVSSNLKVDVLKLQVTLTSNFTFVRDRAPKEGGFTTIFGAKIDNNWFFHFFQYFTVKYQKRIFLYIFSILFGNILHIFGHKIRKLVIMLFFSKLSKRSIITNFLVF